MEERHKECCRRKLEMSKRDEVLKIPIPKYFYEIIVPNFSDYYDGQYPVDFEQSPYVKCCFHDEDTPSLRYFDETNTLWCYGCNTFANTILLHKKIYAKLNDTEISDEEAINFLYNYFIEGKETTTVLVEEHKKAQLNSAEEMFRYTRKRKEYERCINVDSNISLEKKEKMWEFFDRSDKLLEINELTVADAENEFMRLVKTLY